MSLINDALKRAHQSQTDAPPPNLSPLHPTEPKSNFNWLLILLVVLLFAAAGFCIAFALTKKSPVPVPKIVPPQPQTISPPLIVTQKVEIVVEKLVPVQTNLPPAVASAPEFKLQGIFYDPMEPSAIVNGKTIRVNDSLGDFRVKAISKFTVTLVDSAGKEQILELP